LQLNRGDNEGTAVFSVLVHCAKGRQKENLAKTDRKPQM
jgi:hypothetical protein